MAITGASTTNTENVYTFAYNGVAGFRLWLNLRTGEWRIFAPSAGATIGGNDLPANQPLAQGVSRLAAFDAPTLLALAEGILHVATGEASAP